METMKISTLLLVLALGAANGRSTVNNVARESGTLAKEVCYDGYGCFSTSKPWTSTIRPRSALPKPPYEIGTRFLLFTRYDPPYDSTGYELLPDKDAVFNMSNFDVSRRTVFVVHGFTDSGNSDWVVNARQKLLGHEDANVIVVDWASGAKSPYLQATANARLVGRQLSRIVDYLKTKGLVIGNVQVIAHSLGAHVAGYAGSHLDGEIGLITALDPMEPYFGGTDPMVRLDPTDARHVEVIHTNGESGLNFGLGIQGAIGHVDIYPNGGKSQPGCKDLLGNLVTSILSFITLNFEGAISTWACSHARVVDFYVESLTSECPFISYACDSYSQYKKGNCYNDCSSPGSCHILGYGSSRTINQVAGSFFLNTKSNKDFCVYAVQASTQISSSQAKTNGQLTVQLRSSSGELSSKYTIFDGVVKPQDGISTWIEVPAEFYLNEDRPVLVLKYTRGGLVPTTQPKYLILDNFRLSITTKNLSTRTLEYPAVTLEAGVALQLQ